MSKVRDVGFGPRDPMVNVADHRLRRVITLNVPWRLTRGSDLPLNSSWGLLRCSWSKLRKRLDRTPSGGRRRVGSMSRGRRLRISNNLRRWIGGSPISIHFIFLLKDACVNLILTCRLKGRGSTRHSLIECHFTCLYHFVSVKVKDAVGM